MGRICTSKKYLKIPRSNSKYLEVPQSTQKYFKVLKVPQCTQKYLKVLRSTSKYLEVPQCGFRTTSGSVVPLAMFPSQIKFAGTWPGARCRGNVQLTGFTRNRVACHSCHTCMSHWTKIFFSGPDNSVQFTFHSLAVGSQCDCPSQLVSNLWPFEHSDQSDNRWLSTGHDHAMIETGQIGCQIHKPVLSDSTLCFCWPGVVLMALVWD